MNGSTGTTALTDVTGAAADVADDDAATAAASDSFCSRSLFFLFSSCKQKTF